MLRPHSRAAVEVSVSALSVEVCGSQTSAPRPHRRTLAAFVSERPLCEVSASIQSIGALADPALGADCKLWRRSAGVSWGNRSPAQHRRFPKSRQTRRLACTWRQSVRVAKRPGSWVVLGGASALLALMVARSCCRSLRGWISKEQPVFDWRARPDVPDGGRRRLS